MVPNQVFARVTNNRRPAWNGRPSPAGVESPAPSPSRNQGGFDSRRGRCARVPVPFRAALSSSRHGTAARADNTLVVSLAKPQVESQGRARGLSFAWRRHRFLAAGRASL